MRGDCVKRRQDCFILRRIVGTDFLEESEGKDLREILPVEDLHKLLRSHKVMLQRLARDFFFPPSPLFLRQFARKYEKIFLDPETSWYILFERRARRPLFFFSSPFPRRTNECALAKFVVVEDNNGRTKDAATQAQRHPEWRLLLTIVKSNNLLSLTLLLYIFDTRIGEPFYLRDIKDAPQGDKRDYARY